MAVQCDLLLLLLAVSAVAVVGGVADDRWRQQELLRRHLPDLSWSRLTALQGLVERNQHRFTKEDFLDKTGTLELSRSLPGGSSDVDIVNLLVGLLIGPYISPLMDPDISPLCRNHTWAYVTNILSLNNTWALKMFDSDAKLPDGLLVGNLNSVGNWDECLSVEAVLDNIAGFEHMKDQTFRGKHCEVNFQLSRQVASDEDPSRRYIHSGHDGLDLEPILPLVLQASGQFGAIIPGSNLALCIPSSCSAEELRRGLQKRMPQLKVSLAESSCHVKGVSDFDYTAADIVMIVILALTGLFMAFGTFIDVIKDKAKDPDARLTLSVDGMLRGRMSSTLQKTFLSFSVWTNGRKILDTSSSRDTLGCLHGMRFLSMSWVILGHQYYFGLLSVPWVNQLYIYDVFNSLAFNAISNATVSVDSFFFLSGLLVAYIFFRNIGRANGKFNVVMYYVHRYIRLTPVLAMVIGFMATLYAHLGEGPLWGNLVTNGHAHSCRISWWKNLLYINNFATDDMCLGQTWYLANDMQMYILSPIVLLPLYFYPVLGQIWLILLQALNLFISGYVTDYNNLGPNGGDMKLRYFMPYCRYGAYLVGVYTGWFLHQRRGRRLRMSLPVVLAGWLTSGLVACLIVYGLYDYSSVPPEAIPSRSVSILYAALNRPAWAMCLAWVVIACVHGYGGFINSLLSWQFWIPLSRITYCCYLVSIDVQQYCYSVLKHVPYFDQTQSVYRFLGSLTLTMMVSLLFSLAFEAPMLSLEKIIFANVGTSASKSAPVDSAQQKEMPSKRKD